MKKQSVKTIISILLSGVVLMGSLAGCGASTTNTNTSPAQSAAAPAQSQQVASSTQKQEKTSSSKETVKVTNEEIRNKYIEVACNLKDYIPGDVWENSDSAQFFLAEMHEGLSSDKYLPQLYIIFSSGARDFVTGIYAFYFNDYGFSSTQVDMSSCKGTVGMFDVYVSKTGSEYVTLLNADYFDDYENSAQDLQLVNFDLNNDRIWTETLVQNGMVQYAPDRALTTEEKAILDNYNNNYWVDAARSAYFFNFGWRGSSQMEYGSQAYKEQVERMVGLEFK